MKPSLELQQKELLSVFSGVNPYDILYLGVFVLILLRVALYMTRAVTTVKKNQILSILQKNILRQT